MLRVLWLGERVQGEHCRGDAGQCLQRERMLQVLWLGGYVQGGHCDCVELCVGEAAAVLGGGLLEGAGEGQHGR